MIKKLLIALLMLIAALVIGVQLFLGYGLTDSLRKWVLPEAKERLKVDVSVDHVSVNLLAGSVSVHGFKVANPPGFKEPEMVSLKRFGLKIGLVALLRGGIAEIQKAVVKDGAITVIRNKEGMLNIQPLIGAGESAEPGAPAASPTPRPAPEAKKIPNTIIKKMEVKSLIQYMDYQWARSEASERAEEPFKLGLELQARLKDVANYGNEEALSGTVNVLGHILADDKKCAFDLNGRIAPVVDPARMSFDLSGSMQTVDLKAFTPLTKKHGIEGGAVSGTATLLCKKGVFDPEKSVLRLTFSRIQLTEEKRAKIPGGRFPSSLTMSIPVGGPLSHPNIDIGGALEKTLLSKDTFESILKGVLEEQGRSSDKGKSEDVGDAKKKDAPQRDKTFDWNKAVKDMFRK